MAGRDSRRGGAAGIGLPSGLCAGGRSRLSVGGGTAISTGVYGCPLELAAPIAVEEARVALRTTAGPLEMIEFVLYDDRGLEIFLRQL